MEYASLNRCQQQDSGLPLSGVQCLVNAVRRSPFGSEILSVFLVNALSGIGCVPKVVSKFRAFGPRRFLDPVRKLAFCSGIVFCLSTCWLDK